MPTDRDLVTRVRAGDRGAFDRLAAAAQPRVLAVLTRLIGHPEDVEDVAQDALSQAWSQIDTFREKAAFSTWLIAIASRKAVDHLRRQKRWRTEAQVAYPNLFLTSDTLSGEVAAACADPEFAFEVREHIAYCFTCVGRSLPPEELAALVLRDVVGMSAREAAAALGITDSVLRHRLSAARSAMSAKFDGLCALVNKRVSVINARACGHWPVKPDREDPFRISTTSQHAVPSCGTPRPTAAWRPCTGCSGGAPRKQRKKVPAQLHLPAAGRTTMPPKRLPLPVRRQMNLTEPAYDRLRQLNARWGLGNNYLLVVLLENLDAYADPAKLDEAFEAFLAEYGGPGPRG